MSRKTLEVHSTRHLIGRGFEQSKAEARKISVSNGNWIQIIQPLKSPSRKSRGTYNPHLLVELYVSAIVSDVTFRQSCFDVYGSHRNVQVRGSSRLVCTNNAIKGNLSLKLTVWKMAYSWSWLAKYKSSHSGHLLWTLRKFLLSTGPLLINGRCSWRWVCWLNVKVVRVTTLAFSALEKIKECVSGILQVWGSHKIS